MDLKDLRTEIDRIDDKLVRLFAERMGISARIAEYKKAHNLPVLVPAREQEKLLDVAEKAGPELAGYTQQLYTKLFELSRSYQEKSNSPSLMPVELIKCGLLGRSLSHSYSPQIHGMLGTYSYRLFEKEPEDLEFFLKEGDFTGINVTIPYKKDVIPYLDMLSPTAQKLGAVNTIIRQKDGRLYGHNTDYSGFRTMVSASRIHVSGKKVLILGSGGASNTAAAVLKEMDANVIVISRSGENRYENLHQHTDAVLIVNTTPVGMYPNTGVSPVDLSVFPNLEGVLDVIYNPSRTKLLLQAESRGLVALNGLLMLVAQAKEAAEYFTGTPISDEIVQSIYSTLSVQMQNIILIGMPGCGKSTIGKLLSEKCGKDFVDADLQIEVLAGKTIPEIFAQDGEEKFRELEAQVLEELGKQSGLVISTGGGCVTRKSNYSSLHQNGTIVWLKRPLELLPTEGRPLSQAHQLTKMYQYRKPLYEAFADITANNSGAPGDTVAIILKQLEDFQ